MGKTVIETHLELSNFVCLIGKKRKWNGKNHIEDELCIGDKNDNGVLVNLSRYALTKTLIDKGLSKEEIFKFILEVIIHDLINNGEVLTKDFIFEIKLNYEDKKTKYVLTPEFNIYKEVNNETWEVLS